MSKKSNKTIVKELQITLKALTEIQVNIDEILQDTIDHTSLNLNYINELRGTAAILNSKLVNLKAQVE